MGFFSFNCLRCAHPALVHNATDKGINDWMTEVVAIGGGNSLHSGEYDGYGRIDGADLPYPGDCGARFSLYHRACWELAGKPLAFTEQSKSADDQGWFFDDGAHDMLDPRTTQFAAPEVIAERLGLATAQRDGFKRGRRFAEADCKADRETYRWLARVKFVRMAAMTEAERIAEYGVDVLKYYADADAFATEAYED
jgi:hypothetical protein